jgi:molybdate transport system substrate-binding protein
VIRRLFLALAAVFATTTLALAQPTEQPVRVFAAASLTDVLTQLGAVYERGGHARPVFNFAASSVLARQIEQGASADLFISADEPWMDYVAERSLIESSTRVSFVSNKLVLIAPRDAPLNLRIAPHFDLHSALNGDRLAMADPDSVPAGRYGQAALQNLGVWDSVVGDLVRAENVRAALRFVELGEAGAGIVYLTDARASDRVVVVDEFPPDSHPRISYPMAVVRGGSSPEAAAFEAFLQTTEADAVFARAGFVLQ